MRWSSFKTKNFKKTKMRDDYHLGHRFRTNSQNFSKYLHLTGYSHTRSKYSIHFHMRKIVLKELKVSSLFQDSGNLDISRLLINFTTQQVGVETVQRYLTL